MYVWRKSITNIHQQLLLGERHHILRKGKQFSQRKLRGKDASEPVTPNKAKVNKNRRMSSLRVMVDRSGEPQKTSKLKTALRSERDTSHADLCRSTRGEVKYRVGHVLCVVEIQATYGNHNWTVVWGEYVYPKPSTCIMIGPARQRIHINSEPGQS